MAALVFEHPAPVGIGAVTVQGGPGAVLWNAYALRGARDWNEWAAALKWLLGRLHGGPEGAAWWLRAIDFYEAQPVDALPSPVPRRTYARVHVYAPATAALFPDGATPYELLDVTGLACVAWPCDVPPPSRFDPAIQRRVVATLPGPPAVTFLPSPG